MIIERLCSYTYRFIGNSEESSVYYFYKRPSGVTWYIAKSGSVLRTCKSKAHAIEILSILTA
jgi:hypothetical protein